MFLKMYEIKVSLLYTKIITQHKIIPKQSVERKTKYLLII